YFAGTGTGAGLTPDHVIDSNKVSGAWQYGIYTANIKRLRLNKNTVTLNGPVHAQAYGVYAVDCDSSYQVTGNNVTIFNTTTIAYGMALINCDTSLTVRGKLANNIVTANNNNGTLYGIYLSGSPGIMVLNNVVAVNTNGPASYGIYHNNFSVANYYNN